ncbi:MAG: BrnT family toxin [Steroidobacteraceae bacterium]
MKDLRYEWDESKNRPNQRKHGVTFEEARTSFLDENARLVVDPEHSDDEDRFILVGLSIRLRLLVVSHCHRESERVVRILSARKADPSEQRDYARWLP